MTQTGSDRVMGGKAWLAACGLVVVAIVCWGLAERLPSDEPSQAAAPTPLSASSRPDRVPEPKRYVGYYALSQEDKLDLVSQHMHNRNLPAADLAFLRQELANRDLMVVARNNIANALCWQRDPDPNLHQLFMAFVEEPKLAPQAPSHPG